MLASGVEISLRRTTVTRERGPLFGKRDACYLSKGRHVSIPASIRKNPWEDGENASRSFVFLFRPPGLATTADEAGPWLPCILRSL